MAAHASWKGFLKLSLVSVPVKAYTAAASGNDISLHQLHAKTLTRIQYKKFAPEVGEVSNEEIVKGYEYDKGQYVIIQDDEIDKLRTESDKSIRIDGFVSPDAVSSIYFGGRTYYLAPDGPVGQKPYNLLMKGMATNGVGAMAEVVIAQKEQVVFVRPLDGLLAMTVLSRKDEVKPVSSYLDEITDTPLTEAEISLTDTLIKASIIKDFDFGRYKDVYKEKLTQLIQMKIEGKEVVQVRDPEEPKIINLMDALKRSVAEAQAAGGGDAEDMEQAGAAGSEKKAAKAGLKQTQEIKPGKSSGNGSGGASSGSASASGTGSTTGSTARKKKVV